MLENLRDKNFELFQCAFFAIVKTGIAACLISYWEYGLYLVLAYVFYAVEKQSFLQFRNAVEASLAFETLKKKL